MTSLRSGSLLMTLPFLIHNRSDLRRLRFIDAPPGAQQLKHRGDMFLFNMSPIHHRSGNIRIDPNYVFIISNMGGDWGVCVCTRYTVI